MSPYGISHFRSFILVIKISAIRICLGFRYAEGSNLKRSSFGIPTLRDSDFEFFTEIRVNPWLILNINNYGTKS
jgi:hypothetical protein